MLWTGLSSILIDLNALTYMHLYTSILQTTLTSTDSAEKQFFPPREPLYHYSIKCLHCVKIPVYVLYKVTVNNSFISAVVFMFIYQAFTWRLKA